MKPATVRLCVAALSLSAFGLVGCGGGTASDTSAPAAPQNRIVGTWEADVKAMMTAAMPPDQAMSPEMEAMLKDSYMTVEFVADGSNRMTSKMGGEEKKEAGAWELISQDGDTYKLKLTSQTGAGAQKIQNGTAVFKDDDHVTITLEGETAPPLPLTRRK